MLPDFGCISEAGEVEASQLMRLPWLLLQDNGGGYCCRAMMSDASGAQDSFEPGSSLQR